MMTEFLAENLPIIMLVAFAFLIFTGFPVASMLAGVGNAAALVAIFIDVFPEAAFYNIPNSLQNPKILVGVESRRGAVAWALWASLRFLSPLIKPDVRISRIRLPDRLHLKAHGGGPRWTRRSRITPSSPNTTLSGKRLVPRDDTLWRLTRK